MQHVEIERLLRQIFSMTDTEEGLPEQDTLCHLDQNELPGYIEMELNNEDPTSQYPALHAQIAACQRCQTIYEDIKELMQMEKSGMMVEPPIAATFNYSYLQNTATQSQGQSSAKELTERIIDGIKWHLDAVGDLWVQLSDELMAKPASFTAQPAFTKSSDAEIFKISSQDLAPDMVITVTGRELQNRPDRCSLAIDVDIPSRGGWPNLAGSEVVLKIDDDTIDAKLTDAFGYCLFDSIRKRDLQRIRLQIRSS